MADGRGEEIAMKTGIKPLLAAAVVFCASSAAPAAQITWGSVGQITGTGSLDQTGTLVTAINMGGSQGPQAVAGTDITFNDGALTSAVGTGAVNNSYNMTYYDPTTGDTALDTVLDSHSYIAGGNPNARAQVDLTGLTVGAPYRVQVIAVSDIRGCCSTRTQTVDDGMGNVSGALTRGMANFVIGTFTADAPTQSLFVSGVNDPGLSGLQLRLVPEPASAGLLAFGAVAGLMRRRRRA
jgi:hypothetical protein